MKHLLILLVAILLVSCECHYETFRIDNVVMQPIVFTDSLVNGKNTLSLTSLQAGQVLNQCFSVVA